MKDQHALEAVCQQFEQWRATKTHRSRIPKPLWDAAIALCNQHSLTTVSQALRLNRNDLKKKIAAHEANKSLPVTEPALFLECTLPNSNHTPAPISVEIENRQGDRMKIHFTAHSSADFMLLSRTFLGVEQ